jgi:hypothetical protein
LEVAEFYGFDTLGAVATGKLDPRCVTLYHRSIPHLAAVRELRARSTSAKLTADRAYQLVLNATGDVAKAEHTYNQIILNEAKAAAANKDQPFFSQ